MDAESVRAQVREICLALPETTESIQNPLHSAFQVNGKNFAYFLNDHHGDGVLGVVCKAARGVQGALVDMDSLRFYLPAYMARHGWVGMRLDLEPVDWQQAAQLLREAYVSAAPNRLAQRVTG
jgi:phosphoribosylglycinamide formyltransferase-1